MDSPELLLFGLAAHLFAQGVLSPKTAKLDNDNAGGATENDFPKTVFDFFKTILLPTLNQAQPAASDEQASQVWTALLLAHSAVAEQMGENYLPLLSRLLLLRVGSLEFSARKTLRGNRVGREADMEADILEVVERVAPEAVGAALSGLQQQAAAGPYSVDIMLAIGSRSSK